VKDDEGKREEERSVLFYDSFSLLDEVDEVKDMNEGPNRP